MLSGIYELVVSAIVLMNMQDTVFNLIVEWKIIPEFGQNTCQV